jgi:hypothetical protein
MVKKLIMIFLAICALNSSSFADQAASCLDKEHCPSSLKKDNKASAKPTPRPLELPGDTFVGLRTDFYTVETHNKFGNVKSNLNKRIELDFSQRWANWFKIHLLVGAHKLDYNLPFGHYTTTALNTGLDMEFNASKVLSFDLGVNAGDELIFREIQNTGIAFLAYEAKIHLMTNVAAYRSRKLSVMLRAGGVAIPAMDFYNSATTYGLRYQADVNYRLARSWTLGLGAYQENINYRVDGVKQKGTETGAFLNLTWHGFCDD